jgi:hypothetical protein
MISYKYVEGEKFLIVFEEDSGIDAGRNSTGIWFTTKTGLSHACTTVVTTDAIGVHVPLDVDNKPNKSCSYIDRNDAIDGCRYEDCNHSIERGCQLYRLWKHLEEYGHHTTVEKIIKEIKSINEVVDVYNMNKLWHSMSIAEAYAMIKDTPLYQVEVKHIVKVRKVED